MIEHTLKISEGNSWEDSFHAAEGVWRGWFEAFKSQADAQFRDLESWAEKSFESARASKMNGNGDHRAT